MRTITKMENAKITKTSPKVAFAFGVNILIMIIVAKTATTETANHMQKEHLKCPMCKHKIMPAFFGDSKKVTHYWPCPECPFIGFEYYTDQDIENLIKAMNQHDD